MMNGEIAQSLSLVAYANAFLQNQDVVFDLNHSTAQFCKCIEFIEIPEGVNTLKERIIIAEDPQSWFNLLRKLGVERVVLHYLSTRNDGFSDRLSSAFAGGGGRWIIEAIKGDTSDLWESQWKTEGWKTGFGSENRIWEVFYILFASDWNRLDYNLPTLDDAYIKLKEALVEVNDFAKEWASEFSQYFQLAIKCLSSDDPIGEGLPEGIELKAQQLIRASYRGWVFGGMGSWNDLGFEEDSIEDRYDEVSDKLYNSICVALVVAVNSASERKLCMA
jgi:hypothetical protein